MTGDTCKLCKYFVLDSLDSEEFKGRCHVSPPNTDGQRPLIHDDDVACRHLHLKKRRQR